jgi:diguanylate cyclase
VTLRTPSETPDYPEGPEQAAEYLRLALAYMGRHGITPNPVNFALCYHYVAGRDRALNEALDRLVAAKQFTDTTARDLYQRHFWTDDQHRLEQLRSELRRLVMETLTGVTQAHNDATHTTATLNAQSAKLERGPSLDELRLILAEVMTETRGLARNSVLLKAMLDETRHEVESLRDELEHTRQQVTVDALTGLKNRRAFELAVQGCVEAVDPSAPLSLLLVDIDHFKEVNDTYGHLVGDKVIRRVGTLLSANVKGKDTVARLGGEEFGVLLPDTPLANAERVGQALRHTVETSRLRRTDTGAPLGRVTISIGATVYQPRESLDEFIERADRALYQSKKGGRNRVSVIDPGMVDHEPRNSQ